MSVNSEVHKVYDIRLKYSHVKMQSILGKKAEAKVKWKSSDGRARSQLKDEEILPYTMMQMSAEDDSFALLEKTEKILSALFPP